MSNRKFTGSRIRERRLDRGLKQSELARSAGISPSYLNLIEHNRRRIAGRLLNDLARALEVEPQLLSEGAERTTMEGLARAAARPDTFEPGQTPPEQDRVEEFAGRFPGWAALLASQERRLGDLEDRVRGLSDRLAHDPELANALHEVISAVTSIQSTSAILTGSEAIDADWQQRFHRNIHSDAERLAGSSQALVRFLDASGADRSAPFSPVEEADALFEAHGGHFAAIEQNGVAAIPNVLNNAAAIVTQSGRAVAAARLATYAEDAKALPLAQVSPLAHDLGHDPLQMADRTGAPYPRILRRLSTLPTAEGHPVTGLAVCDSAGALIAHTPFGRVDLPRSSSACPLWPLFEALSQPGRLLRQVVQLSGPQDTPILAYASAAPAGAPGYMAPAVLNATMLLMAAPGQTADPTPPRPLGLSCRVCPRPGCDVRREPSILHNAEPEAPDVHKEHSPAP